MDEKKDEKTKEEKSDSNLRNPTFLGGFLLLLAVSMLLSLLGPVDLDRELGRDGAISAKYAQPAILASSVDGLEKAGIDNQDLESQAFGSGIVRLFLHVAEKFENNFFAQSNSEEESEISLGGPGVSESSPTHKFEQLAVKNVGDEVKVLAEEDERTSDNALLASENFQISQISIGGGAVILGDKDEGLKLSISDVRSEVTAVKDQDVAKAFVFWKTNKMSKAEITYEKQNQPGSQKVIEEEKYGYNHTIVLTNLELDSSYTYQIKCKDRWGNELGSDKYIIYSGVREVSIFELISGAMGDVFGWAIRK